MTDHELDPGSLEEPALRARIPILRRRPLLPAPEVVLLLDRSGRIVRSSARFSGERLGHYEFTAGLTVHDVFHDDCDESACTLSETWERAWTSHKSGLPVEWLWLSTRSNISLKLRLQAVSYACGVLFGDSIGSYENHSVLFVQDLSSASDGRAPDKSAEQARLENAVLYMQRRSYDSDPDLIATLDERLRRVTGRLLVAQETERRRLAAELHDGLGQSLSLLRFEVESLLDRVDEDDSGHWLESCERLNTQVRRSLAELRDVTSGLLHRSVTGGGLLSSLDVLCSDFRAVKPSIELRFHIDSCAYAIPAEIGIAIYRIVQEGLNNIVRHSGATHAAVELSAGEDGVRLSIEDDGTGIQSDPAKRTGLGLITMRERAERLAGTCEIGSRERGGCRIDVSWPLTVVASLGDESVLNSVGRNG